MPKISVIIPVYNAEKYLKRCMQSLLQQKFDDYELICVDDGSPDNCGKMLDEYASIYPQVKVFHQKNAGVSSARNLGLDNAKGDYITFVDPDDYVARNYFVTLGDLVSEGEKDLYIFSLYRELKNGEIVFEKVFR